MIIILKIIDKNNREIYLTDERYLHILKHPEMQNSLYKIEEAIKNSDFIEEDLNNEKAYYYKYIKNDKKHIMVVVKIENNLGNILTAYMVQK